MGYMLHHAIVVHSYDASVIAKARAKAIALGLRPSEIQPPDMNNMETGFYVPPDGSKEGWPASAEGDDRRKLFTNWVDRQAFEDGSNAISYVEVSFGGDDPEINTKVVSNHTRSAILRRLRRQAK